MSVAGDDDTLASSLPTTTTTTSGGFTDVSEMVAHRYRIVRWLGGGGMGRVYEALDTELDEHVALKVLRAGLSADAIERFRREVKLTRRIVHPNVARMFDIGDHGTDKFLTMELVAGDPLTGEIRPTPMPWPRLKAIAVQICAGLAAAHKAGVIHRDLKPDNVLVERGTDRIVITDFGIARGDDDPGVTQVGAVVGTPRYMAPEQLAGRDLDARADLFSLGVILFELATGTRPWTGDNAISMAVAQATTPPRILETGTTEIPAAFATIVAACLELDADHRPPSADAIAEAITTGKLDLITRGGVEKPRASMPAIARAPLKPAMAAPPTPTSIAVLPIACAPGDEYLADGLLDDIIDTLSTTEGLRVRPAGIVRSKTAPDPRELGRGLQVDHVVVSTLRRSPTGLRVAARLISIVDGFQIWATKVDCAEPEILDVSEKLAHAIADALSTRAPAATKPLDSRAVDLYLRARAELRRFWGSHAQAAADMLEKAAEYAPSSPPILGALAYATVQAWVMRSNPDLAKRAELAIERGLATGHGEAYLASAQYHFNRGDFERGGRDLGTALLRAPMLAQAHELAGKILVEIEGAAQARTHFETAVGLDPGRGQIISSELARLDALEGNWSSADARIAILLADPDPSIGQLAAIFHARLAGWRGDLRSMAESARRFAPRMAEGSAKLVEIVISAMSGGLEQQSWEAMNHLAGQTELPVRQQLMGLQLIAEAGAAINNRELAVSSLERAAHLGLMDIVWFDGCPLFMSMVEDRRFMTARTQVARRASAVLAAFRSVTTS
ncbi:MAG: serine/threonine protein kinase [Myxococcales bacterium]|nr:serine/threonine protein kinase [Myxococcales bacterium]